MLKKRKCVICHSEIPLNDLEYECMDCKQAPLCKRCIVEAGIAGVQCIKCMLPQDILDDIRWIR